MKNSAKPKIMRSPRTVEVEVTSRCNQRCRYCYYFDNPAIDYVDLPSAAWLRFFDELGQCAVMDVTLQGGEPFIREDLPELIQGIVRNRMRFSVLSNGTLIDDSIAKFIAETKRCDRVQVSVDGSCAEIHDASRGKGSFEKAMRGIRTIQQHGIPVGVRVTITHYNVNDLENIAHLLLEELNLPSFGTNSAGYLGSCRHHAEEVMLSTKERGLAMQTLLTLTTKYNGRIEAAAGPLAEARMWYKMNRARIEKVPAFSNGGYLTGCGCYTNKIAVRSDGAIIPCPMLAHMKMGNINKDSLIDIWQNNHTLNQLRMRSSIPLTQFAFCKSCPYIPYCTGNCPGLSYTLTNAVNHPSPDACLRHFIEQGGSLVS